jgi:hypothetical protein
MRRAVPLGSGTTHIDLRLPNRCGVGGGTAGERLPLVCAQNGVAGERMALRRFRRVYGMCVWLPSTFLRPGHVAARNRVETLSALEHRPITALEDRLAGDADEATRQLWDAHRKRAAETFLGRLEDEVHGAVEVARLGEIARRAEQHGRMSVMPAGVCGVVMSWTVSGFSTRTPSSSPLFKIMRT